MMKERAIAEVVAFPCRNIPKLVYDTYRTAYTVRFEGAVYVLHAFQKKSPSGIRTASPDVELIRERLKRAREDYETRQQAPKGTGG